ncbi:MAG: aldehyde dehydrogenase family protein [Methanomicrobiaceae archaeon]|nr:aldehyde dehydrogenase family protein [Methanomicrobiaceae archaeon]
MSDFKDVNDRRDFWSYNFLKQKHAKTAPIAFIVGGKLRKSEKILDVTYPYTGEVFSAVYLASSSDTDNALEAAKSGFNQTKNLKSFERQEILERLSSLIKDKQREFVEILIKEGGKVRDLAEGEVKRAIETIKISAEESVRIGGEIIPLDRTFQGANHIGFSKRFPIGTVLAITPFNYPLNLACHKIGPAIAAGNSFVLKPASKTPVSALLLGDLIIQAGYPEKAVNVLPCSSDLAEKMVSDDRIAFLSFTGSPDVGWHLKSVAGRKKVGLELGGNAAVIVHEDTDLEHAAAKILTGVVSNAGQVCISVQRIFAHRNIYDDLLFLLKKKFEDVVPGSPFESGVILGPMISENALLEAMAKINDAKDKGAKFLWAQKSEKNLLYPILIENSTPEMSVNSSEIFAPAATITRYDNFEDAIKYVNNSPYGLQSGIFTKDIGNILNAFENIESGGVVINDIPTFRVDCMPYGGIKMSGFGREGPRFAIEEMTEEKLLIINKM